MGGRQAGKLRKVLSGTHSCSLHMIDRRTKRAYQQERRHDEKDVEWVEAWCYQRERRLRLCQY